MKPSTKTEILAHRRLYPDSVYRETASALSQIDELAAEKITISNVSEVVFAHGDTRLYSPENDHPESMDDLNRKQRKRLKLFLILHSVGHVSEETGESTSTVESTIEKYGEFARRELPSNMTAIQWLVEEFGAKSIPKGL